LLSLPVVYRGGAEAAHPHVFVQLWIDAEHGSFDHHHRQQAHEHMSSSGPEHGDAPPPRPAVAEEWDGASLSSSLVPEARSLVMAIGAWFVLGLLGIGIPIFGAPVVLSGRRPSPDRPPPRPVLTFP
jgi:hypothetical protein